MALLTSMKFLSTLLVNLAVINALALPVANPFPCKWKWHKGGSCSGSSCGSCSSCGSSCDGGCGCSSSTCGSSKKGLLSKLKGY